MKIISTTLKDCFIIETKRFPDHRGYFFEYFNSRRFLELTHINLNFVQDNVSVSTQGVLRGLHYQIKNPQGKLVGVLNGEIFDVAVDLRIKSPTYGKWFGTFISEQNGRQLWVPPGFAHGFLATSKSATVYYKVTDFYVPADEKSVSWNDPYINVQWPIQYFDQDKKLPVLSDSDRVARGFFENEHFQF